jgi:dipeptidyl aminopeptidase/acylaminoacyl peptidase
VTKATDEGAAGSAKATPAARTVDALAIEHIVGTEAPREFRLDPRGRVVACTLEYGGARQLFTLPLRGGPATQVTASEKNVSDPRWSPDGRRLAFVRDGAISIVDADGSRLVTLGHYPAGESAPRWSPDGRRIAFISRRRGWAQVWTVDAPVPRRGRPAATPKPERQRAVTPVGFDVDEYAWSPDGTRLAIVGEREEAIRHASRISVVTIADGAERRIGEGAAWECGVRWLPDGGLVFISDADGWFQVVRLAADLTSRTPVTAGAQEHGEPGALYGLEAHPSPDGRRIAHPVIHDGLVDLAVSPLDGAPARARRPKSPPSPMPAGTTVQPWPGVWRTVGWLPDGAWIAAMGESESRPQDLWLLPVPGLAPVGARPRQLTSSLPAVLAPAASRFPAGERVAITARDGLRLEGTLWRPATATGRRGGSKVPAIVYPHGGPTSQAYRTWLPFKQLLVSEGFAFLDIDFRGSTGYGRAFRDANTDEWGHADVFDVVDAGRWLQEQAWCDGRLGIWGGSYGGYLVLGALVDEPAMWRAGVDLFGDSEIAESYRHGDRVGRLDLQRQMGRPDDPERAPLYRRGSPLYRAEHIQAPLLILHGRKDKRVVPLMSEKMIEALEIEGKFHEVHWYEDEGHGWQARENRRDAFTRIRDFLKTHVLDAPVED